MHAFDFAGRNCKVWEHLSRIWVISLSDLEQSSTDWEPEVSLLKYSVKVHQCDQLCVLYSFVARNASHVQIDRSI